eukprot:4889456-Pleurochrysis_carterae.AAC.1
MQRNTHGRKAPRQTESLNKMRYTRKRAYSTSGCATLYSVVCVQAVLAGIVSSMLRNPHVLPSRFIPHKLTSAEQDKSIPQRLQREIC